LLDWRVALLIGVFAADLVVFTKLCLDELRSGKRMKGGARPERRQVVAGFDGGTITSAQ
jgi:hypothetical protein